MSLQDAAEYFKRRKNSPVERGLAAGRAAYEGDRAPQRSGIGAVPIANVRSSVEQALADSARQRQVLADTAQKQALGLYPNTGTSAAAYDYLRGKPGAKYPVNPVLAGQPGSALTSPTISRPYEQATKVGGPTQKELVDKAAAKPEISRAGYGAPAVRQPGLLDSLLGMALPAYLGYKGYQYLAGLPAAGGAAGSITGVGGLPMIVQDPFGYIEPAAAVDASEVQAILDRAYSTSGVDVASAGAGGPEFLPNGGGEAGAGATTADITASLPALNAEAGEVGYMVSNGQIVPATAEQIAAAQEADILAGSASDIAAGAGAEGFAIDPVTGLIVLAALSPEGQGLIQDTASNVGSVLEQGGDIVSDILSGGGGGWSFDPSDWAKGGQIKSISNALPDRYNLGGYSDDGDTQETDNPLVPRFSATNSLGRMLDDDLVTAYQKATQVGNVSKAKALKNEIDYRNRMRSTQTTPMATGGISGAHYNLGGYSDGGRLLKGPGDGVSDSIPATIGQKRQPARLADGEFVVPARIVSELGNGSTEAGARKLYAMMDRIQASRKKSIGKGRVAVNNRADKYLPK